MKLIIFILLGLLPGLQANTQGLDHVDQYPVVHENTDYSYLRQILNKHIPDMPVEDILGQRTTLAKYIRNNMRLHDKPVLLISTYSFCGYCKTGIKKMYDDAVAGKYNIVVLYEEFADAEKKMSAREFSESFQSEKEYPNLLFVKTDPKYSKKYLLTVATPLYLVTDAALRPVYSSLGYDNDQIPNILNLVDRQLISRERISYSKSGKVVANNDKAAYYTIETIEDGNRVQLNRLIQKRLTSSSNYLLKDHVYLKDGAFVVNELSYARDSSIVMKQLIKTTFKEGRPAESFTEYFSNGKKRVVWPLNGKYEVFDKDDNLVQTGPVKDGLGEGLFKMYTGELLSMEITYVQGLKQGAYKIYEAGKLKTRGFYRDDEEYGLKQEYDKEGLLSNETWVSQQYDFAGSFSNGLAHVKLNGKYGYINKSGEVVIPIRYDAAEKFEGGKAKVTKDGDSFYINMQGEK